MMLKNIKAAIFDLDGTLIDSLADIASAANYALTSKGFPTHPVEPFRYFIGEGMHTMLERCAPKGTPQEIVDELVGIARDEYAKNWAKNTVVYQGIGDMLSFLQVRGIKLSVLSNKHEDFTKVIVQYFFSEIPFVKVKGSSIDKIAKPDPQMALDIASVCEVTPGEVLFMGDTKIDMQTAVNAAMHPVGVLWGFRERAELQSHGAKVVIAHPMELSALLP